ncbi:Endopolyphosphatase [Paramyrothecium foliicola]|nr:Endopolyphosphatase [Paramyrothecium foliicola]
MDGPNTMPSPGNCLQLLAVALGCGVTASPTALDAQHVLGSPASQTQPRRLHGRFLHITDFHPDGFYKAHTATEDGIACHRGRGPAGPYGAEKTDCDSPFSLVNATFQWLEEHVRDKIDFIIWTGDTARHDSDEKHPRNAAEVIATNRIVSDKFIETFSSKNGKLEIPIVPTFGNNDFLPHNIFYPGPNKWLHTYGDLWKRFIPEDQYHSFQFGGWFHVDVIPGKLAVFSLNTMYFFDRNAGVDGCANPREPGFQHLEWLRIQLQRMRDTNMKAILMGHVPPARTDSKRSWDETCWQKYTLWLQQFRDVVVGAVYGHMNIDHFLLQDTREIDLSVASTGLESKLSTTGDISKQSKGDYLQELRDVWSNLPSSVVGALQAEDYEDGMESFGKKHKGKKKPKDKFKKIGGPYAERYQVTLISPSVVPNYFPTLRIIDYNITGLENTPVWIDGFGNSGSTEEITYPQSWEEEQLAHEHEGARQELRRDLSMPVDEAMRKKKKNKKGRKDKKPHDPNLVVPDGPPKDSGPGPAYLAQPLTFTGYTQYFANLTYLNNKSPNGDKPISEKLKPRKFKYEVLYSTFDDKIYKLSDLTVRSFLKLAYRIGLAEDIKSEMEDNNLVPEEISIMNELDEDDNDEDDEVEVERGGKKHKKKKKKGKHGGKKNKVWLHFLNHAFVSTVSEEDLQRY